MITWPYSRKTFTTKYFVPKTMGYKYTSLEIRNLVVQKYKDNLSASEIARLILLSPRTVYRILKTYREEGWISCKKQSGRPPKSTEKSRSILRRLAVMCPKMTSKQLRNSWADGQRYSDTGVRRILCKYRLFCRRPIKKPLLNKKHEANEYFQRVR